MNDLELVCCQVSKVGKPVPKPISWHENQHRGRVVILQGTGTTNVEFYSRVLYGICICRTYHHLLLNLSVKVVKVKQYSSPEQVLLVLYLISLFANY